MVQPAGGSIINVRLLSPPHSSGIFGRLLGISAAASETVNAHSLARRRIHARWKVAVTQGFKWISSTRLPSRCCLVELEPGALIRPFLVALAHPGILRSNKIGTRFPGNTSGSGRTTNIRDTTWYCSAAREQLFSAWQPWRLYSTWVRTCNVVCHALYVTFHVRKPGVLQLPQEELCHERRLRQHRRVSATRPRA